MDKTYLVLADGKIAKRRGTLKFALRDAEELKQKGYRCVSVAEDMTKGDKQNG